jgi:hypothetical protein
VQVQAVAATERPLKKVDEQTFDLPKGSKIKVWLTQGIDAALRQQGASCADCMYHACYRSCCRATGMLAAHVQQQPGNDRHHLQQHGSVACVHVTDKVPW